MYFYSKVFGAEKHSLLWYIYLKEKQVWKLK